MRWIAIALLTSCCNCAFADYLVGNELYPYVQKATKNRAEHAEKIDSADAFDVGMERGYVAGVQDTFNGALFCVPPEVTLSQSVDIVTDYLRERPEIRHEAAKILVWNALTQAFPCETLGAKK